MGNPIVYGLIKSLHDLGSIIWIGSLFFMSLFLVPAVNLITEKKKRTEILNAIFDKLTYFVIASIILLMITGILEHNFAQIHASKNNMKLAPAYKIIHLIKYVLTGLMVIIAILRQTMRRKAKRNNVNKKAKNPFVLIYINSLLGLIVVILSGILAAFS